jgi:hypothetical protein
MSPSMYGVMSGSIELQSGEVPLGDVSGIDRP